MREQLNQATESDRCRCGHDLTSDQPHPCHALAYTCGKPAKLRMTNARLGAISGMQFKVLATDTYACDDCWRKFLEGQADR